MSVARVAVAALVLMLTVAPASAQQWNVDGHAGRIRSALDPAAAQSESVMLGLRYDDALTGFRLSAGVPTTEAAPLWGALGIGRRFAMRRSGLIAGIDVSGHGFVMRDRAERTREVPDLLGRPTLQPVPALSGHAIAGQAMPIIGFESGSIQAHLRAGLSSYTSEFAGQARDRIVRLADAQLSFAPIAALAVTPTIRHYRGDENDYTYAGVTGIVALGRARVWGSAGQWLSHTEGTPWAAGAVFKLHERASFTASARRDGIDPLYLNPPQTAWSVGLSVQLSRAALSAPVPAAYSNGRATIRLPANDITGTVSIAGDFNAWKPQPMQRAGNDWTYTVPVAPGVYNYAFVDPAGQWFVPEKHPGRKADGMGGHVAVLVVQ